MKQDIWSILQIAPTTSKREIRRAYAAQAQKCHPEEQPEEFAKLQEAYQLALAYQEQSNLESWDAHELAEFEVLEDSQQVDGDEAEEDSSNVLLAALESSYEVEQKRRQNEGALKALITLFEEPKTAKGNKAWAEFFLSDAFLKEYFAEDFAEALDFYLEHQSIYAYDELPQGFLVEWAISYAMTTEADGCMYQTGDIPMRKIIAKYWNQQTEMWRLQRGTRMLARVENQARIQAFSDYIFLRKIEKEGKLLESNEKLWFPIVWHGEPAYLYEVSKGAYGQATSTTILRLFEYWIANENMPYFMVKRMYDRYQLKTVETSTYRLVYKELKETILQKYPNIEGDDIQEVIKKWALSLMKIECSFMEKAAVKFKPETKEETEEIHKLFAREEWKKYWNHPFMMQWLMWKTHFHNIPLTIAQYLYEAYSSEGGLENQQRKELREHSMRAIVNYKKAVEQTKLDFWEYLFMRGFGLCNREAQLEESGGDKPYDDGGEFIYDNRLYLPAYLKRRYIASFEWQKRFVNYNEETGEIDELNFYEFRLPNGDLIRVEYHLFYIAYYRNGERKYAPFLSYESFVIYQSEVTIPEEFFFLLALTCIEEENRQAARELVLKWLPKTELVETTFSVIADCIVQNNAEDRQKEVCAIMENASGCLVLKDTLQGLQLYEYTEKGLKLREFRAGYDWKQYSPKELLREHLKPIPKKIACFDVKELSAEEKTKVIYDGLMMYARHERGAALSKPILPNGYPELASLFENGMGWLTDSFVVLKREISRNNIRREVLYISVGDYGCYSSYLRDEDREKEQHKVIDLMNKVKRSKYESSIWSGRIVRDSCTNRLFSWTEPIVFGKNGKVYGRYNLGKLCETESALELLMKMIDVENVVSCEVYEGKMMVSKQTGQLEYCFSGKECEEVKLVYDALWQEAYTLVEAKAEAEGMFVQSGDFYSLEDEEEANRNEEAAFAERGEKHKAKHEKELEEYKKDMLRKMTNVYLEEMSAAERFRGRCETLVEYYCNL